MLDDEYLNGQARLCGIYATGVYLSLCRHASKDQECFPSIKLISEELAISRDSVIKGIKALEDHSVITIKKARTKGGTWQNNIYVLLDKSEWSKYQVAHSDTVDQVGVSVSPSRCQRIDQVAHSDTKETHTEGNTFKETHIATPSAVADPVNRILELFQMKLNPTVNFGNKTQRKAIEELLQLMGENKLCRTIDYVESIKSETYAPTITTPHQLKEKLAQLMAYYSKQSNKQNIGISI